MKVPMYPRNSCRQYIFVEGNLEVMELSFIIVFEVVSAEYIGSSVMSSATLSLDSGVRLAFLVYVELQIS